MDRNFVYMRHKTLGIEEPKFFLESLRSVNWSFAPKMPEDQSNIDKLNELKNTGMFDYKEDEWEEVIYTPQEYLAKLSDKNYNHTRLGFRPKDLPTNKE